MLRIVPKHWFSWGFAVRDGDRHVADIDMAWWRERGVLAVEDRPYEVYREGVMSGAFILASPEGILARAEKPSAFFRSFVVEHAGRAYTLQARSAFFRSFVLLDGPTEVGTLTPDGPFTRRASADLPEDMPLPVRVFVLWLALLLWKRQSDSSAAAGS